MPSKNSAPRKSHVPDVAVLLCTYKPDDYLRGQLRSLDAQTYPQISIWVSQDSMDSKTTAILDEYDSSQHKVEIRKRFQGPAAGFAANFLSLLNREEVNSDYFAFCDQDDVWDTDKIERAVEKLSHLGSDVPAVYCSRTRLIDESGAEIGYSPLFTKPPSFRNAIVQSVAGGNTMVLNKAARNLVRKAGQANVVCHDWWVYLLVSGAGGTVLYDSEPTVSYRQHGKNLIGANHSWRSSLGRFLQVLSNRYANWQDVNLKALEAAKSLLTEDSRTVLELFQKARNSGPLMRLVWLGKSGVYRQTYRGTLSLVVGVALGRI